ncbi:Glycosyltransferase involved in cell wall bisynthesis [Mucilaginibacter gossypiicola]|uniref:Glycosyltransferase involved in cell wall bisynthesis n=1 Tax=Mucilaginibacter gossypiicola TaxID=551995 RepID=A0A1H8EM59_9SPHI|nr:glycosyltransferase family 4 protein [Mucilaginibacter gossypiicola]SEN20589.1 Glycosyltransferase involved in cell wall bisynthesis [Mucilaginibacter gossypiicola]
MKILILTHRVPFPQNGGYAIVVCNTIKGLIALGHEVALVALNGKRYNGSVQTTEDELLQKIRYTSYDININVSVLDAVTNLFNKKANDVDRYYDAEFEKLLLRELRQTAYDVIQFEGLFVTPYLAAMRKHTQARLIYRSHNIEHQVWMRLAQQKSDLFKKWYLHLLARRVKDYELQQLNKFDGIAVFTNEDKKTMVSYGVTIPVDIFPVGISLPDYKPDYNKTEFPSLFFLGSLDWMPNREGIEWFIENFYKDLTEGDLRVKFYVAGHNIPDSFDDYEAMGKIFIQGEVDDASEFVNSKAIMVVPLLSSGGMRVKIVEGMAMEKCIISTSLGAEGINFTNGANILIANNRQEFYDAIARCITDEEFCRNIGLNARRLIEEQHDVHVIAPNLVAFYQSVEP